MSLYDCHDRDIYICLKGLYHRRVFVVCLQSDLVSYECMGFVRETSLPEMKSIAGNDDRRVKQTMLYTKRVAIINNKLSPNRTSVTLFAFFCFNITISCKYVFYRNGSVHVISFQVRVLENTLTSKNPLIQMFYILFYDGVPLISQNECKRKVLSSWL